MIPRNEWLIMCARICDQDGWFYAILAQHYDFKNAYGLGLSPKQAIEASKVAWHKWMVGADKRNTQPGSLPG